MVNYGRLCDAHTAASSVAKPMLNHQAAVDHGAATDPNPLLDHRPSVADENHIIQPPEILDNVLQHVEVL